MNADRQDTDIFRLSFNVDDETTKTIADRLEFRASDAEYSRISQAYFDQLPLGGALKVISIGCGTGVEVRALRRRMRDGSEITGVDHSARLIDLARNITSMEGLDSGVLYGVGNAHHLDFPDGAFDLTILHTLISHVDDPFRVLQEARRVTKPGGTIGIFDGDYASITFGYPDDDTEQLIEESLMRSLIANPRIMRNMPQLLRETALDITYAAGFNYANIGEGTFWANVPAAYAKVIRPAGGLSQEA